VTSGLAGGVMRGLSEGSVATGDRAMQAAVGRKKFTPGVGEELADAGLIGTREGMRQQVKKKIAETGGKMQSAAAGHPNMISSQPVADAVRDIARRKTVNGNVSILDQPAVTRIGEAATDIDARGMEGAQDLLKRRGIAGNRVPDTAWANIDPAQALTHQISKAEQMASSRLLKENIPDMIPLDKRFAALARARSALNPDQRLGGMSMPTSPTSLLTSIPGSSLGLSTIGQGAVKAGQAGRYMTPAMIRLILEESLASPRYADEGQQ